MLAAQRHNEILNLVHRRGQVKVADLSRRFGVSEMTIRRDIDELDSQGKVTRVHGGALRVEDGQPPGISRTFEPDFLSKRGQLSAQKQAIAAHCAQLLKPGASVVVGAGSTTYLLAEHLLRVPGLNVITNSYPLAASLFERQAQQEEAARDGGASDSRAHRINVVLCGGELTPSRALVGPAANRMLRTVNADLTLLGAHAIDAASGLCTPNMAEAETNGALLDAGASRVILADHTKFGLSALAQFAEPEDIDSIVTDTRTGDVAAFAEATGVDIRVTERQP